MESESVILLVDILSRRFRVAAGRDSREWREMWKRVGRQVY